MAFDAFFYHKIAVVPWNIIAYNIFSDAGKGPDIFGTEPFDFYFRNLLLNFHLWFVLALIALPVVVVQFLFGRRTSKFALMRSAFFVAPFYMWLAIFSLQSHKEERFMYPAYPFLGLNAAISLHAILAFMGTADPKTIMGKIPAQLKFGVISLTMLLAVDIGVLRAFNMVIAYRAPQQIYSALQAPGVAHGTDTVCLGKEWYRFPSSYFLPQGMHAKFVRSEFDGLLPGEFNEAKIGFGFYAGTWLIPSGMNDMNIADPGKLVRTLPPPPYPY
jgi:alpha-1,2-mannosyltransferase